ncbi:MAG: hypothetical protein AAGH60_13725 [Pseudomonadota bacterium]
MSAHEHLPRPWEFAEEPRRVDRVLSNVELDRWSADELSLAVALARKPAWFVAGLAALPISLRPLIKVGLEPVLAHVPLEFDEGTCTIHISSNALDALAGVLSSESGSDRGLGRSMSLDALEAIMVALLSPVGDVHVGRATWSEEAAAGASASLCFGDTIMPVWGDGAGLVALYRGISQAAKSTHSAMLSHRATHSASSGKIAVIAERLLGTVQLAPAQLTQLEVGGGVTLDTHWPQGLVILGRRFCKHADGWGTVSELRRKDQLVLRSDKGVQSLGDPNLGEMRSNASTLLLMDSDTVVASGSLAIGIVDGKNTVIFRIEQLR